MSNGEVEEVLLCMGAFKKSYKKGETILEQGSITHEMGLILSGAVIIESCDMWGNNTVLGVNGEGDVFAEAYACAENEVLRVSVRAIKNSEILFFSASKLFFRKRVQMFSRHRAYQKSAVGLCFKISASFRENYKHIFKNFARKDHVFPFGLRRQGRKQYFSDTF